jgi:hypothetical protein
MSQQQLESTDKIDDATVLLLLDKMDCIQRKNCKVLQGQENIHALLRRLVSILEAREAVRKSGGY